MVLSPQEPCLLPIHIRVRRTVKVGLGSLLLACTGAVDLSQAAGAVPVSGYKVLHTYPHDSRAYTEGLYFLDAALFESTGLEGQSDIRKVRLRDGVITQVRTLDPDLFGEGIVNWGSEIISLTWRNNVGFRWDAATLVRKSSFRIAGEGWGLTQDGRQIIMSDGTPVLQFLDPKTLQSTRRLTVTAAGKPVENLNELEWVKGEILANVWLTNRIARIDPVTGVVKAWIDLSGLPEAQNKTNEDSVLNGIAYDAKGDRLFVTGKNWPHLYEIALKPGKRGHR